MVKSKKFAAVSAVFVLLGLGFTACNGSGPSQKSGSAHTNTKKSSADPGVVPGVNPNPGNCTFTSSCPTTTTSPAGSLIETLQAFFANGCNGACADTSEPTSAFTLSFDPNNPNWAMWTINDPNLGTAYGFYQKTNGLWQVVAGPGSADVGCPGATGEVPTQVLSDFGETCSGSNTGTSGNTGSGSTPGTSGNTGSGGPSSEQLQEAYRAGSLEGENLAASGSTPQFAINGDCRTFSLRYPYAAEQAQFQDGCLAAAG
jgi:hypothetical protein